MDSVETRQLAYRVRGQEVEINERIGIKRATGRPCRSYDGVLPGEAGFLLVIVITDDVPDESLTDGHVVLSESQVRRFFESFQPRDGQH